jgi:hypothetical protein
VVQPGTRYANTSRFSYRHRLELLDGNIRMRIFFFFPLAEIQKRLEFSLLYVVSAKNNI